MNDNEANQTVPNPYCPFFAKTMSNERITSTDHFQDTRHLVLDISHSKFDFSPGDVLAIHPLTPWKSIDALLSRLGVDPFSRLSVECKTTGAKTQFIARSLVQGVLDVDSASPRRFFFEVLSHFAKEEKEKERLAYLSSASGREELSLYNRQSGRTVLEILSDFVSCQPPMHWILESCPRKTPRRFSIASSLEAYPQEVHLTVAIVEYVTKSRRIKHGLCTSYLTTLQPDNEDAVVPCWVEKGSLDFGKALTAPLLLIGPGTGVAPFRSILQKRHALRSRDHSYQPLPSYLLFGSRNRLNDFYYAAEWDVLKKASILHQENGLITAFSRDQSNKIYVTHRIAQHGSLICDLLMNQDAFVYVAGSAKKMPADVRETLTQVLVKYRNMTTASAEDFLKQLDRAGRYQVESWS